MNHSPQGDEAGLRPLDGLLVADFSRVLAGPLATMTLADLGATVVKVEHPGRGDDTRAWGPPWTATSSSYFESVNRSKYSVALNLADPDQVRLAHELAHRADVVVENFRTGTMERYGLGYADVVQQNPGVVYCSITGFGSGAGAQIPGYDFVVQAVGGLMSITGDPEGEAQKAGVALVDVLTGKDATIGILAALAARRRDGRGRHVEVNLLSSLLGSLVNQISGYLATGESPTRMGNRHPSIAPYEVLRCGEDGRLAVACGNDGQFRRLAAELGLPSLADDERFSTNAARVANRDALVTALEAAMATADAETWEKRLLAAGVSAGRVADVRTAVERADELGLDPTVDVGDGHPRQIAHPIRYSTADPQSEPPVAVRSETTPRPTHPHSMSPPPELDEHGDTIRRWLAADRPEPLPHPSDPARP
ncbi:CaiB/BaiF CoA transferase family protein [Phytoactinopolyspora halotolerans]|uniref:CoA transferase n=1 Tax=Phytoactinopolyspora halotolerans TaxID=1981512 RepID=A0A6L9S4W3_9ACTN|nr:CoA transferase [Phytoactinopolyspora halotolerans]NEE00196.1 CoA transferase [Phytoactinopolyspora halotolerans]